MIGIDEVGRGCWAGPLLVVAARKVTNLPPDLRDSKKISASKRKNLYSSIKGACDLGEGWVTAREIDKLGLTGAMGLGVDRALDAICADASEVIIMDGLINYCTDKYLNVTCAAKADDHYPIVSAASIYAKVSRDNYMSRLDNEYLVYEFAKHVGYGTKLHHELLKQYGASDQHRLSFAPLKKLATL